MSDFALPVFSGAGMLPAGISQRFFLGSLKILYNITSHLCDDGSLLGEPSSQDSQIC